jgi:hypothetical protein
MVRVCLGRFDESSQRENCGSLRTSPWVQMIKSRGVADEERARRFIRRISM